MLFLTILCYYYFAHHKIIKKQSRDINLHSANRKVLPLTD